MIRKATIHDVKAIHSILVLYSQQGSLLGRSLSDLYDQIRDFFVYVNPDNNAVTGVCALHICWGDIAEIRSLAVVKPYSHKGIGTMLVHACVSEARELGIQRLFVLTYVVDFFKKFGFYVVNKAVLPHKVWADCINCIKFPDCDEEALILDLDETTPRDAMR